MCRVGLKANKAEPCLFSGEFKGEKVHLAMYVDDGMIVTKDKQIASALLRGIANEINIREVSTNFFIGMEYQREGGSIRIHQRSYIERMLK